jgi:glucose-6-phosphate-specific signal transduction histidine kinase
MARAYGLKIIALLSRRLEKALRAEKQSLSSSLLRFAHKILKNRRLGDFLPYKLRKHAHKSGFLASLDTKNPQVQQAAREAVLAREQERSRIARELHDTVAQDLWRLSFRIDSINKTEQAEERRLICEEVAGGQRELMRRIRAFRQGAGNRRPDKATLKQQRDSQKNEHQHTNRGKSFIPYLRKNQYLFPERACGAVKGFKTLTILSVWQ